MRSNAWIARSGVQPGERRPRGSAMSLQAQIRLPDMIHTTGHDRQAALMQVQVGAQDLAYGLNARGPEG